LSASVYLITGFTGSLGSFLTRKLLAEGHKVRGVARNEHNIERLVSSIPKAHQERLSPFIGDVRDRYRLWRAFAGVEYIIHAAALKGVNHCEYEPSEAIKTNIEGTVAVFDACLDTEVSRAVLVSSDKAVSPSNLYGMTKATAERVWLAANRYCGSRPGKFVAVRYGNVWRSNGSVLHIWEKQLQEVGKLTITNPECTRFHLRLSEAADFVLKALHEAEPETLRVPIIPSYRLADLAKAFAPDAQQEVTGLRPGEKKHEAMVSEEESIYATKHAGYYSIKPGIVQGDKPFTYTSGTNTWRLTVDQLRKEVERGD
jgi:UDP-N-acetylglucosamine 4,6-dehydratase